MSHRPPLFALLLATTALTGPVTAQEVSVQLNQLTVEGTAPAPVLGGGANLSGGDGGTAATSGGGGGPSGVTGYTARISPTETKTNTPLLETPQSVTVLTREALNDRNVQTLNEAIGYVAGVSSNVFGFDPRFDSFFVRGFSLTYDGIFRDGLRQVASGLTVP
ncbi:TonB-dependent receptor plug domain-containing protein [Methylobacterium sp. WCS2018Hpa-22]|uniref:TonB-dependent receptor plug domain-containing protein n=1 Tax=Methylobacterium sp. WCS2018Hpa-22 TaxID=3073633 RepID=UPI0038621743